MDDLTAIHRLATYGTLTPGEVNAHQLEDIDGQWTTGTIRATLVEEGWGAQHGCPGCILDPSGDKIDVFIFESPHLPDHWDRLDSFEGDEYQRSVTIAETKTGSLEVSIYQLNCARLGL